jgi:hypothetical protein
MARQQWGGTALSVLLGSTEVEVLVGVVAIANESFHRSLLIREDADDEIGYVYLDVALNAEAKSSHPNEESIYLEVNDQIFSSYGAIERVDCEGLDFHNRILGNKQIFFDGAKLITVRTRSESHFEDIGSFLRSACGQTGVPFNGAA